MDQVEVTILTQPDCANCERAEEIIERLAGEFPIAVSKVQLQSESGRQLAQEWAAMFAPVVLIDGSLFSQARLSENDFKKELQTRLSEPA